MKLDLNGSWQFRGVDRYAAKPAVPARTFGWMPASVPGTVHTDLMARGIIADPHSGMNELDVQWIESLEWRYRRTFTVSAGILRQERIDLMAEGLDTYARIEINGKLAGTSSNMFIAHRFDVKPFLRQGRNTIEIVFDSPVVRSKRLERRHGPLRVATEPHRVYVRKAQYSFGWDWGPKLTTSGIWRNIYLEAVSGTRLADPFVRIVSLTKRRAVAEVTAEVRGTMTGPHRLAVYIGGTRTMVEKIIPVTSPSIRFSVEIPQPELWWPNGCGKQPLYTMVLTLYHGDAEADSRLVTFACRTVTLVQEKDAEGKSFILKVNGIPVFCKGMDWIPSDNFIPRIADATYERLLTLARDAGANMLRVWGGGIYEQDIFYELCDRLGLMVWQDFMYACGEYPQTSWFRKAAKQEAEAVVRRLRNHPSIVVWCGNNECEWLYCTENPGRSADDMTGAPIFRDILPSVCRTLDGTRPYWRSSPFGTGFPNSESNGNHHQWMVWSFWKDFSEYEHDVARFVTEFGFQAPANRQTLEAVIPPAERFPQSRTMEHHNKQVEGQERLYRFQAAHFYVGTEFDDFIYKGQLVQAGALKTAFEHWRRRKFRTAGALVWQLNDCWPVSSWAIVDSALRPKAAYYQVKRSFAPVLVSFRRTRAGVEVWVTNDRLSPVAGTCRVTRRKFRGGITASTVRSFRVAANSSVRIMTPGRSLMNNILRDEEYLLAELLADGATVSENRFYFAEPKHLKLPVAHVTARWSPARDGSVLLKLRSDRLVKCVRLEFDGVEADFSDNYFDIDAGKPAVVRIVSGETLRVLRRRMAMRWLAD